MLTGLERIRQLVTQNPNRKLQTLMHLVNTTTLKEIHARQKEKQAAGTDGTTKSKYNENLEEHLSGLVSRMKTFSYKPQPVRRAYIPKDGSDKLRPLGIYQLTRISLCKE